MAVEIMLLPTSNFVERGKCFENFLGMFFIKIWQIFTHELYSNACLYLHTVTLTSVCSRGGPAHFEASAFPHFWGPQHYSTPTIFYTQQFLLREILEKIDEILWKIWWHLEKNLVKLWEKFGKILRDIRGILWKVWWNGGLGRMGGNPSTLSY